MMTLMLDERTFGTEKKCSSSSLIKSIRVFWDHERRDESRNQVETSSTIIHIFFSTSCVCVAFEFQWRGLEVIDIIVDFDIIIRHISLTTELILNFFSFYL